MTQITLISGSTLGNAEYVAEYLNDLLHEEGFSTLLLHGPDLNDLSFTGVWLVISSTYGAGEVPTNLQPLVDQLREQKPNLDKIKFGAIGLGSSEYDQFCQGIDILTAILVANGAHNIGSILKIDATEHQLPEDPAQKWLTDWIKLLTK